jgi:hypothetical protein
MKTTSSILLHYYRFGHGVCKQTTDFEMQQSLILNIPYHQFIATDLTGNMAMYKYEWNQSVCAKVKNFRTNHTK